MFFHPGHHPLRAQFFGQRARACIVHQDLAGPFGAQFAEQLVKPYPALTKRVFISEVAEGNHAIRDVT